MTAHDTSLSKRRAAQIAEGKAFLSLAKRQRHFAQQYRTWAREAERDGKLDAFRHDAAEARKLFRDARDHLQFARRRFYG